MLINNYLSSYCSIKKILLLPQHTTEWKREACNEFYLFMQFTNKIAKARVITRVIVINHIL